MTKMPAQTHCPNCGFPCDGTTACRGCSPPYVSEPDRTTKPDLAYLEKVARANGYWHYIEPFADEIERLRAHIRNIAQAVLTSEHIPHD